MYAVPAANSRYSSESDGTNVDNSMDVSRTVELENELNEFLTNLSRDEGYEDNDSNTDMVEDRTVPLEDNVADVINNNSNNNNNNPSSPTNSIDLADAMSVASAQNTPAGHAHGTFGENDASIQDSGSKLFDDSGSNNDVDRTVELEVSDFLIICYITLNQTNPKPQTKQNFTQFTQGDLSSLLATMRSPAKQGGSSTSTLHDLSRRLSSTPMRDGNGRRLSVASVTKLDPASKSVSLAGLPSQNLARLKDDNEQMFNMNNNNNNNNNNVPPLMEEEEDQPPPPVPIVSVKPISITCEEIMAFSQPSSSFDSDPSSSPVTVTDSNIFLQSISAASTASIATDSVLEMLNLAIDEVEQKASASETGSDTLSAVITQGGEAVLSALRSVEATVRQGNFLGVNDAAKAKFTALRAQCKRAVVSEWEAWEEQVSET